MSLILTEKQGRVLQVTLNRPDALNALSADLLRELDVVLKNCEDDSEVGAVVITGAGRAFAAGADIAAMYAYSPDEALAFSELGHSVFDRLAALPQPVVAAINGYALGGGLELALAADIRYASEKAKLGSPEISLGIIPGFGATQRLPRLVGRGPATEMLLTGRQVDAATALRLGLVTEVFPADELLPKALDAARILSEKGRVSLHLMKEAIAHGLDSDLRTGLMLEAQLFSDCFRGPDQKEGMSAFLEKRPAKFH
jgi:enoyl-CoA hydratase